MPDASSRQNVKYYDAEAAVYDSNRYGTTGGRRLDAFQKSLLDDLLAKDLPAGAAILELGCGTGRFLLHLARGGFDVTGLDVSAGMLDAARAKLAEAGHGDVDLVMNDASSMPFPDDAFDAVLAILVINLLTDYVQVFREVSRVVKPGGVFVFSVPNLASIYGLGGLYVNLRGKTVTANQAGHRHSHWFTKGELRRGLAAAGFSIEEIRGQAPHVKLVERCRPMPGNLLGRLLSKSLYIKARSRRAR